METNWGAIIFGVIFIAVTLDITVATVRSNKAQIRRSLEEQGAGDIVVSWLPLVFDRINHSYRVTYTDADGEYQARSCTVGRISFKIRWWDEDRSRRRRH